MGFNTTLTPDQVNYVEGGGYRGRDYLLATPLVVVFQCQPAFAAAEDVTFDFEYTNVTIGAYTDVRPDMVVLITTGTTLADFKRPLWRGRITKLPTADTLFINESSIALNTSYYVSVLDTYDAVQRLRSVNLVDGHLPFEKLAPLIQGLSSSYVKEPVSGEATFTFSPTAIAPEEGDSIDDEEAWAWEIDGVTYDTREVEVTLAEGHYWAIVECTSANGVTGSFVFEIYVVSRYDEDFVYLGNDGADITNDWDNGVNATLNYFEGVEDILDRTRVTIVTFESYRDGDPAFFNISFVGYLRQDDNQTRGDATYGTLQQRTFTVAGFNALMGECKLSPVAVLDKNPPAAWDEMRLPNAARVIAHIMNRYSTLARLVCIDLSGILSNDWYGGDMDIESPYLLDACNTTAKEINAQLIFAPDGQITVQRNLCMLDDTARDAADVIMEIGTGSMTVFGYKHAHLGSLAQLLVGFRTYRTADKSSTGFTGTAPAVALDEGADFEEQPSQLLTADASDADATLEARARTGNLYAWLNDADEITVDLDDGFRWAQPGQHYWFKLIVPASDIPNGIPFTTDDRVLLKSVSYKNNVERGTRPVRAILRRETKGGLAMILVAVVPSVVRTALPPRPPLGAYPGIAPSGTLNYLSQTPARRTPYSGRAYAGVSLPYAPAEADKAGQQHAPPGCRIQNPPINFRNPANVNTPFITVNGQNYAIFVKGFARIANDAWNYDLNSSTLPAWVTFPSPVWGSITGTVITQLTAVAFAQDVTGIYLEIEFPTVQTITSVTVRQTAGTNIAGATVVNHFIAYVDALDVNIPGSGIELPDLNGAWVRSATGTFTGVKKIVIQYLYLGTTQTMTWNPVTIRGTGDNPFTGQPGRRLKGDAFYQWEVDDSGEAIGEAELYPDSRGLRINSSPVAVPPMYNANHEYAMVYEGTGNAIPLRFQDDNYDDNENALLYALVCGPNAGT